MSGENDASVFTDGQSVFHYENGDVQQAYADAMAATNDDDYQARMRTYARVVSETRQATGCTRARISWR